VSAAAPTSGGAASAPKTPVRSGWWVAKRFLPAALGIVMVSAIATVLIARNEVAGVVEAFGTRTVKVAPGLLASTSRGQPETILLVGNDERPPPADNPSGAVLPHSNEMLLVRIDPSKPTISMLSIPREWWVPIHRLNGAIEENRINSAYTFGYVEGGPSAGLRLMLETIKQQTGLSVNRVFITNFHHFRNAVDEMGCVYAMVDKRYYHRNEPGGEQYFEINLQPGYQRLCGQEALEFVANRHESTSLIRDSRDQRFLLEVKSQYGPKLFEDREKFERIFGHAVQTANLHGEEQVLQLLDLLVESAGKPVRQVHFPITLHSDYDTASPEQVHEAVSNFLTGTAAIAHRRVRPAARAPRPASKPAAVANAGITAPAASMVPTSSEDLAAARAKTPYLSFPLEYPRVREAFGGAEPDNLHLYKMRDLTGRRHEAYVISIDRGELGQFYDVQGTTWTDPPLLANPAQTVAIGARNYELFYAGEHLKTIAWREHGAVYWIENTLTNDVPPASMLTIAENTRPVLAPTPARIARPTRAQARSVAYGSKEAVRSTAVKIWALCGVLALALIGFISLMLVARQRDIRALATHRQVADQRQARVASLFAIAGPATPPAQAPPPPQPPPPAG
jgi:LCP family protein required for cell wall assembly